MLLLKKGQRQLLFQGPGRWVLRGPQNSQHIDPQVVNSASGEFSTKMSSGDLLYMDDLWLQMTWEYVGDPARVFPIYPLDIAPKSFAPRTTDPRLVDSSWLSKRSRGFRRSPAGLSKARGGAHRYAAAPRASDGG